MSIFEDLIEELKEENLIEQTVIETSREEEAENSAAAAVDEVEIDFVSAEQPTNVLGGEIGADVLPVALAVPSVADSVDVQPPPNDAEFYRKQALDEVAFLEMVEAAFAGVEREQLKIVPVHFADLEVKKVLHSYLQVAANANTPEHSKAEFQLLQETESWYSSLSLRDNRILTAHLRRYCETSRPPLSSPALIALARFYRNSPYAESIRSKFDLVLTRLFSREIANNRREMVFTRGETSAHIQELYAEWSSVPLYSTETDDREIAAIARQFEELIEEADRTESFNELINNNYFNRLRLFKENANENFYAPLVAALGIECNVRVGNRYVELLESEKENVANLENRHGFAHDNAISEATGKTLTLVELLNHKNAAPKPVEAKTERVKVERVKTERVKPERVKPAAESQPTEETKKTEKDGAAKTGAAKSGKWMIALAVLAVVAVIGIYLATKSAPVEVKQTPSAPTLNLENSMLREYLQQASIKDETLNGIVMPSWNHLTVEKKKDVLKLMLNVGSEKGYKAVQLTNKEGKAVATAANGNVSLLE